MLDGSRVDLNSCMAGANREWNASISTGALGCDNSGSLNNVSASSAFDDEGFSRRTCLPFRRALCDHSKCRPLGSGM